MRNRGQVGRPVQPSLVHREIKLEASSGPLPNPDTLSKYAEIIPNGAERIMAMAEREQGHRHRVHGWDVITGVILQAIGVAASLAVAGGFMWLAYSLFMADKDGAAFIAMLPPLAALCTAVVGLLRRKKGQ